jgi:GxxExxY protein
MRNFGYLNSRMAAECGRLHRWASEFAGPSNCGMKSRDFPGRVHDEETYRIIGAAMQVHRTLGCGFLESVYQEALAIEFEVQGIPFQREVLMPVHYRGYLLGAPFRIDFVCCGSVVVELKAQMGGLNSAALAQTLNYLKGAGLSRGLLLNFGTQSLQVKRVFHNPLPNSSAQSGEMAVDVQALPFPNP